MANVTTDERQLARPRFHARVLSDGRTLYWWVEIILILGFYAVYSAIRNANQGGALEAFHHARELIGWERGLHLFFEHTWQHTVMHSRLVIVGLNYVYGSLHFVVTAGVIVYLFRKRSDDYPLWRNTLAATTALALTGFIFWPLMPPRLLDSLGHAHYGFIDTLAKYPTIWSFDSGGMQKISNQFAAMPSLHFGWSLFCAFAMVPRVRSRRARIFFASYPALTFFAIVATGNHFWLDAGGGALVLLVGSLIARRFTRAGRTPEPIAAHATADTA